ncbi:MAG: hypothetical protein WC859_00625 [Elusimicrobiota bacterium]|jgi:type II secretory pathway pseudopilin PulG
MAGLLILLIFYGVPVVAAGYIARQKKRSVILWALAAVFFSYLALIVVALLSSKDPKPATGNSTVSIVAVVLAVIFGGLIILGILSAIAIPQFIKAKVKADEDITKSNLQDIRLALDAYYGSTSGHYPKTLEELTSAKGVQNFQQIPEAILPRTDNNVGHPRTSSVTTGNLSDGVTDTGGWFYDTSRGNTAGRVVVNCSHQDVRSKPWDKY